ncbi:YciC family protein [Sansalvadorimonas verongulae]|uniref:YciC family protein n=1 Tax=Sansalvadorimonas verongulae TaxID=2172824 RepID=UPI0012BCE916|nr:YciC family protein [Sansalvadorimonas verongulae]MTI12350.1 hypothetical protein [Sansalvadorimonas verongulae]
METTLQQVQSYLRDTFTFFRSNMASLALIVIPYALLSEVLLRLVVRSMPMGEQLYAGVITELALYPIVHSVLILYMAAVIGGQRRSVGECYTYSVSFWPRMMLLTMLSTIAIMAGLSLFVIPGLIIVVRLSLSDMYCMLERTSVTDSIRKSLLHTGSRTWVIFLGLAFLFPMVTMASLVMAQASANLNNPLISVIITMVQALLQTLYPIYLYRIYSSIPKQTAS